jgi:hypothetical protein
MQLGNSMQCRVDAAGQLNSMLCLIKIGTIQEDSIALEHMPLQNPLARGASTHSYANLRSRNIQRIARTRF